MSYAAHDVTQVLPAQSDAASNYVTSDFPKLRFALRDVPGITVEPAAPGKKPAAERPALEARGALDAEVPSLCPEHCR